MNWMENPILCLHPYPRGQQIKPLGHPPQYHSACGKANKNQNIVWVPPPPAPPVILKLQHQCCQQQQKTTLTWLQKKQQPQCMSCHITQCSSACATTGLTKNKASHHQHVWKSNQQHFPCQLPMSQTNLGTWPSCTTRTLYDQTRGEEIYSYHHG